jgi:hypothetical protein
MSDYGLDGQGSIPGRAKDFSSDLCIQTGSGAHPASYPMAPRGKVWLGRDTDHSPHLVLRSRTSRSYIYLYKHLHGVYQGQLYFTVIFKDSVIIENYFVVYFMTLSVTQTV